MQKNSLEFKVIIVIVVVLLAILSRFLFLTIMNNIKNSAKKSQAPDVKIEKVKEEEITKTFELPARVVSKYQIGIMARISGYLEKSYFKEGDYVNEGNTLFLIEPLEFENASNVAASNIANLESQLNYANKEVIRAEELIKNDYIAHAKYDEIVARRDSLMAQLNGAKATFSDTKRNLKYTNVKAPISGRIGVIDITVGNFVSQNAGNLTTIYSMDPMYVTFSLKAEDYSFLSSYDTNNNRKVELYYNNGVKYEFDGVQDFLDNKIDESTGTVTMRATFKNPDYKLLHGELVTIKLYMNNKFKVPIVPVTAVLENQEGKYLYKLNDKDLPVLTYIKTQGQYENHWIVNDGVSVNDRIITDGIQKVIPGNKVNIIK